MEFEEKFGVRVDLKIPDEARHYFYQQWAMMTTEGSPSYSSLDTSNLMTKYEHFITGSGVGMPPNPFKILRLYGTNPDLEKVVEARQKAFPKGEKRRTIVGSTKFPRFRELTGLYPTDCSVEYVNPQVESDGRVQIPEVIAFYDFERRRIDLSDLVLSQLQFPTTDEFKFKPNLKIKEVFDYRGGYRLELVPNTPPSF